MIKNKTQLLYLTMSAASLGMGILFSTLLARFLGPDLYGRFAVLLHIGFILAPLTALVPNLIFSRVHGALPGSSSAPEAVDFGPFFALVSVATFPLLFGILWFFPIAVETSALQKLLALLALYANVFLLINQSYYQIRSRYERYLTQQILIVALKAGLAALVFASVAHFSLEWALVVHLFATLAWVALSSYDLRRKRLHQGRPLTFENITLAFRRAFRESRSIFLPSLFLTLWALLLNSLDVLMAQRVFAASDLSVYAVLSGISKVTLFLPAVVTPLILEKGYRDRREGEIPAGAMLKSMGLTLFAGLVVSGLGHVLAPWLIPILFGRDFVFQGWAIPFLTFGMSLLALLSFYVHYEFGRGRRAALALSVLALSMVLGASFLLPQNLTLNQYCAFVFGWPVLSWFCIFSAKALTRAATR